MIVYVEKVNSPYYRYTAHWLHDGNIMTDRFKTLKDLHEYTAGWNATYHYTWKEA